MNQPNDVSHRSPAEIEQEIEETRERMSQDIDAISEKFSPAHMKLQARKALSNAREAAMEKMQEVAGGVGQKARQAGTGFVDMAKKNPVPMALIGAGIAWLILGRNGKDQSNRYRSRETQREPMAGPESEDRGGIAAVKDKAHELTSQAGEKVSELKERATESAKATGERAQNYYDESPLIVAVGVAALGVAIGAVLPRTRPEDRMLGRFKGEMVDKVKDSARELTETAKETTQEVLETLTDSLRPSEQAARA